jgi:hypothetical protein
VDIALKEEAIGDKIQEITIPKAPGTSAPVIITYEDKAAEL